MEIINVIKIKVKTIFFKIILLEFLISGIGIYCILNKNYVKNKYVIVGILILICTIVLYDFYKNNKIQSIMAIENIVLFSEEPHLVINIGKDYIIGEIEYRNEKHNIIVFCFENYLECHFDNDEKKDFCFCGKINYTKGKYVLIIEKKAESVLKDYNKIVLDVLKK